MVVISCWGQQSGGDEGKAGLDNIVHCYAKQPNNRLSTHSTTMPPRPPHFRCKVEVEMLAIMFLRSLIHIPHHLHFDLNPRFSCFQRSQMTDVIPTSLPGKPVYLIEYTCSLSLRCAPFALPALVLAKFV